MAKWNWCNQTIRHQVQNYGYTDAQVAMWEPQRTPGKLQVITSNYISMKKDIKTINKCQEEMKKYSIWNEEHSERN